MKKILCISIPCLVLAALVAFGSWRILHAVGKKYAKQTPELTRYETWSHLLGLNDSQRIEIGRLEASLKMDLEEVEPQLALARIDLCRLMMRENESPKAELSRLLRAVGDYERHQEAQTVSYLIELKKILSPDQQKKLFKTLAQEICVGCRSGLTHKKIDHDLCGFCLMKG